MSTAAHHAIQQVMDACLCSKHEAIDLLKHSGNDVQLAKRRHQMKVQFGWSSASSSSRKLLQADKVQREVAKHRASHPRNLDSDDYDIITPQSDREVFSKAGGTSPGELVEVPRGRRLRPSLFTSGGQCNDLPQATSPNKATEASTAPVTEVDDTSLGTKLSTGQTGSLGHFLFDDSPRQSSTERRQSGISQDPASESACAEASGTNSFPESLSTNAEATLHDADTLDTAQQKLEAQKTNTEAVPTPSGTTEWNFVLPRVSQVPSKLSNVTTAKRFDARYLVSMMHMKPDEHALQRYFNDFEAHSIRTSINWEVEGFPSIFYAVATNNDRILRIWIEHGADVNAVHPDSGAPLLAFAIVHGEISQQDTTDIVATLLSTGASPLSIAEPFYKTYYHDLPEDGPSEDDLANSGHKQIDWLKPATKLLLTRSLNLTHRYNLARAARTPRPSIRQKQVADLYGSQGLLGLPYFLIGQTLASSRLLQTCINHLASQSERRKPLVIVFAGPSGHGKTELARMLGYLMSLELEVVDCTIINREIELFGGRHPYVNAAEGTPINNFLAKHSGRSCVVFMDEFEKTTTEIHQALLLPFDNGEYQDRRNLQKVDCSKTIWILATNALDQRIKDFCKLNEAVLYNEDADEENRQRLMKGLAKTLKSDFLAKFGAPVTGRISAFLPFLPFSTPEQAVIAHKYLRELQREVATPVRLTNDTKRRLIGNVRLHLRRGALICAQIARDGYFPDLGARSLRTAVDEVRYSLENEYLQVDEAIRESDQLIDFMIDIRNEEITVEKC